MVRLLPFSHYRKIEVGTLKDNYRRFQQHTNILYVRKRIIYYGKDITAYLWTWHRKFKALNAQTMFIFCGWMDKHAHKSLCHRFHRIWIDCEQLNWQIIYVNIFK